MYIDTYPSDYSQKYIDTNDGEKTMYKKQSTGKTNIQLKGTCSSSKSSPVFNAIGSGILYSATFYHLSGFTRGAQNVSIAIVQSIVQMKLNEIELS
jgi:hypothetical protein